MSVSSVDRCALGLRPLYMRAAMALLEGRVSILSPLSPVLVIHCTAAPSSVPKFCAVFLCSAFANMTVVKKQDRGMYGVWIAATVGQPGDTIALDNRAVTQSSTDRTFSRQTMTCIRPLTWWSLPNDLPYNA